MQIGKWEVKLTEDSFKRINYIFNNSKFNFGLYKEDYMDNLLELDDLNKCSYIVRKLNEKDIEEKCILIALDKTSYRGYLSYILFRDRVIYNKEGPSSIIKAIKGFLEWDNESNYDYLRKLI